MQFPTIFNRHSSFLAQADAYADGELRATDRDRFEAHLASCERCRAAVQSARELKAVVRRLPEATAPRSFRITPALLAAQPERSVAATARTPLYLGIARATAGLAVFAFAGAFVLNVVGGSGSDGDADTAGALRETSFEAAADSAGGAPATNDLGSSEPSAQVSVTPQIAPAATGGASGSSFETPPSAGQTPAANRSSSETVPPDQVPVAPLAEDDDGDEAISAIGYDASATAEEDDGASAITVGLGVLAATAVAGLAAIEITRRARRA